MISSIRPMRAVRGISQSVCIAFLLFTCGVLIWQTITKRIAYQNIVLVHGAWADGSGWKGVYEILVKDGYNVSIVTRAGAIFPGRCNCREAYPRTPRRTEHPCRS